MNLKFIKRGVVLTTLATTLLVPFGQTFAAEQALALPQQNNKSVMNRSVLMDAVSEAQNGSMLCEEIKIETGAEIVFREMFRDKAFAILEEDEDYLIVKAEADEQSEWLGKVQADTLLQVIEKDEEYALVSSGNLEGYINIEETSNNDFIIRKVKNYDGKKYPVSIFFKSLFKKNKGISLTDYINAVQERKSDTRKLEFEKEIDSKELNRKFKRAVNMTLPIINDNEEK
jgi:hypothetical protein